MKLNGNSSGAAQALGKENFFLNFMLGGLSGCIGKTVVAPTERIKLIM